jgi:hypothetical protein
MLLDDFRIETVEFLEFLADEDLGEMVIESLGRRVHKGTRAMEDNM